MSKKEPFVFLQADCDNVFKLSPRGKGYALCSLCDISISIESKGKKALVNHCSSKQHLTRRKSREGALNCSFESKIEIEYAREMAEQEKRELQRAMAEGAFVFHSIAHGNSFKSLDCISQIVRAAYDSQFHCSADKARAICRGVFGKYATDELRAELRMSRFCTICFDCSTFNNQKLLAILVRYYVRGKCGPQIKLLDVVAIGNEKAQTITDILESVMTEYSLWDKVVSICADNTNANFGGMNRNGTGNIFALLKQKMQKDGHPPRKLYGNGCIPHIINNAIQNAIKKYVPIEIKPILRMLRDHFFSQHGSTRVDLYKTIVSNSGARRVVLKLPLPVSDTRWLALVPAIERLIECFYDYAMYFDDVRANKRFSCKNIATICQFFQNPLSLPWLQAIYEIAISFETAVRLLEGDTVSIMSGIKTVDWLRDQLVAGWNEGNVQVPESAEQLLADLPDSEKIAFKKNLGEIYKYASGYISDWSEYLNEFKKLKFDRWLDLDKEILFSDIEFSLSQLLQQGVTLPIDKEQVRGELDKINLVIDANLNRWNEDSIEYDQRWHDLLSAVPDLDALPIVLEFAFALAPSNASTERVFSKIKLYWSDTKSNLSPEMLKAAMQTKINIMHHNQNCGEFVNFLENNQELVKQMHSSNKYPAKRNSLSASLTSLNIQDSGPLIEASNAPMVSAPSIRQSAQRKRSKSRPRDKSPEIVNHQLSTHSQQQQPIKEINLSVGPLEMDNQNIPIKTQQKNRKQIPVSINRQFISLPKSTPNIPNTVTAISNQFEINNSNINSNQLEKGSMNERWKSKTK